MCVDARNLCAIEVNESRVCNRADSSGEVSTRFQKNKWFTLMWIKKKFCEIGSSNCRVRRKDKSDGVRNVKIRIRSEKKINLALVFFFFFFNQIRE